jgi:two-component system alkaline phosphatase synthesis response regulator PhoP
MMPIKKILIVDDEPDILEFLSYNFRKKEFEVVIANNGVEGAKMAAQEMPDLIISDILMPEMDGIEMCKQIKTIERLSTIPFIFLTAVSDDYKVLYAMTSGANQYVSKPVKFDYLLTLVNDMLEEKRKAG